VKNGQGELVSAPKEVEVVAGWIWPEISLAGLEAWAGWVAVAMTADMEPYQTLLLLLLQKL
jgi:hypothetical protein